MTTTSSPVGGGRTDATIDGKWRRGRRRSFFKPDRSARASFSVGGEENKGGELPFFFVSRFEKKPWLTNRQSRA